MRPYEGIKIIDITHVLAGPFAAYQMALLGADVIKVEHPTDYDQSRDTGSDRDRPVRARRDDPVEVERAREPLDRRLVLRRDDAAAIRQTEPDRARVPVRDRSPHASRPGRLEQPDLCRPGS